MGLKDLESDLRNELGVDGYVVRFSEDIVRFNVCDDHDAETATAIYLPWPAVGAVKEDFDRAVETARNELKSMGIG